MRRRTPSVLPWLRRPRARRRSRPSGRGGGRPSRRRPRRGGRGRPARSARAASRGSWPRSRRPSPVRSGRPRRGCSCPGRYAVPSCASVALCGRRAAVSGVRVRPTRPPRPRAGPRARPDRVRTGGTGEQEQREHRGAVQDVHDGTGGVGVGRADPCGDRRLPGLSDGEHPVQDPVRRTASSREHQVRDADACARPRPRPSPDRLRADRLIDDVRRRGRPRRRSRARHRAGRCRAGGAPPTRSAATTRARSRRTPRARRGHPGPVRTG